MKTRTHQQQQTIHSIQSPFPTPTWHVSWSPSLTKSFFVEPFFYFFFVYCPCLRPGMQEGQIITSGLFLNFPPALIHAALHMRQ